MPAIAFDRSKPWNAPAYAPRSIAQQPACRSENADAIVEWEFSEAMRSPRLPAGWFVLPSAALSFLMLLALAH
jgi:hypothetical protein